MSTEAVLDDEMEAMLREIEGMGMTPEAPPAPAPASAPEPAIETTDEAIEALAAMLTDDIEDISVTEAERVTPADVAAAVVAVQEDDMEAMVAAIEAESKAAAAAPAPTAAPKVTAADLARKRLKDEGFIEVPEVDRVVEAPKVSTVEAVKEAVASVTGPTPTDPENVVVKPAPTPARAASASTDDILDTEQIKKDIAINPTDLDTALIEHPGLQMHYALKTAGARRAYERLKSGVEILEAKLDASYRDKLFDGTKKPTEASIRNAVVGDAAYAAAQAKLIDAQHLWKMCEAVESSFHSRKDILLEVARDRRKEREGAMRVLDDTGLRERVIAGMTK